MVRLVREGPAGERSHIALYLCSVLPVDVLVLRLPQHDPASDGAVLRRDRDSGRRHARGRLAVFGYAHLSFFKNHQRLIDEGAVEEPIVGGAMRKPPTSRFRKLFLA